MNIQDRKKSFTAEELRRRYNLDGLDQDRKAIQLMKETLNHVEVQFQRFIDIINRSLKEYPSQADGNITAWFFNGIPTETQPVFTTEEDHLGDLYYDKEHGKSYKYQIINLFDKDNANILNGFATVNTPRITGNNNFRSLYIPCSENTTYTISKIKSTRFSVSYTTEVPTISMSVNGIVQNNNNTQEIFTTGSDAKYLVVLFYNAGSDTLTMQEILNSISITTIEWSEVIDNKTNEVLAIESSSADTADNKRVIFIEQPTPLYEIGDVWLNGGKYYRCRSKRTEGVFNALDWIPYTDYTDDMVSADTTAELNHFEKDVKEGYVTNATLETTTNSINARVDDNYTYITQVEATAENNKTATDQQIQEIKNTVEANQTSTAYEIQIINQQLVNGVVKFDTGTGYTFDIEGLKINKTDSIIRLILDNNGLVVYRNNDEVLRADSDGVNAENMTVRKFYVQKPIRVEKTKAISDPTKVGWGLFWVGE